MPDDAEPRFVFGAVGEDVEVLRQESPYRDWFRPEYAIFAGLAVPTSPRRCGATPFPAGRGGACYVGMLGVPRKGEEPRGYRVGGAT